MKYLMLSSCFARVHFVVKFYGRFHLIRRQGLGMNSLRFRQKARKTLIENPESSHSMFLSSWNSVNYLQNKKGI
jgi:hypothetical protein